MIEIDGHCGWNPASWGDCAGDAAGWVADQAGDAWDAAWEVGNDTVSGAGDLLKEAGEWTSHNADALLDVAVDVVEIVAGAAALVGGVAMVVGGVSACLASTPLVVTGVGAVVTGGVCWGGAATAVGGVLLAGVGIAMMADGGSRLGDDFGRLENPRGGEGGSSGTPVPDNPKLRDDRWLRQNGVDPHTVKDELPGRGGYQDLYVDKNGNIYAVRKGTDPNDGEYVGNIEDFQD